MKGRIGDRNKDRRGAEQVFVQTLDNLDSCDEPRQLVVDDYQLDALGVHVSIKLVCVLRKQRFMVFVVEVRGQFRRARRRKER
jgi:hypothetical protein